MALGYSGDDNSIAQQITKGYFGDDNSIARKLKKGYYGDDNGIARLIYSSNREIFKVAGLSDDNSNLYTARCHLAAATVGNNALFAGGCDCMLLYYAYGDDCTFYDTVDVINQSLTRSRATNLSQARAQLAGASVGNYALFASGRKQYDESSKSSDTDVVDTYNQSLTRGSATPLTRGSDAKSGISFGEYALFVGELTGDLEASGGADDACVYNASLTKTDISGLSSGQGQSLGVIGDFVIVVGGGLRMGAKTVCAINKSLTVTALDDYYKNAIFLSAATVGDHVIFGGSGTSLQVYAFDASLTRILAEDLQSMHPYGMGAHVGVNEYGIIAGGETVKVVEAYNESLTRTQIEDLMEACEFGASTVLGDYTIVAGGFVSGTQKVSSAINIYSLK